MSLSIKPLKLAQRLRPISANRLPVLEAKAGTTPRIRGERWMRTRREALVEGGFTCVDCGHVSAHNEVDHDTPLEQGGSNDPSNLRVRCTACHKKKTANEAKERFGKY